MKISGRRSALMEIAPSPDVDDPRWQAMVEAIDCLSSQAEVDELMLALQSALLGTSYDSIGLERFRNRLQVNMRALVDGARQRRGPGARDDGTDLRKTGSMRAVGGVKAPDMVHVTLIAQQLVIARLCDLGLRFGAGDGIVVEALQYLDEWMGWQTSALLAGHRDAELAMAARDDMWRERAVRRLLSGALSPVEAAEAAAECGLDMRSSYLVLCAPAPPGSTSSDVRRELAAAGLVLSDRGPFAFLYGDLCMIVSTVPDSSVPFPVGVSNPARVADLAEAFRLASRCADAARELGWNGFVSMGDLSVRAALSLDQEVRDALWSRYVAPFLAQGAAGEAILDTVTSYLAHQRSVSATGRAQFAHVNTIRYRISRFETITGCSLRDLRTVIEAWWVLQARGQANRCGSAHVESRQLQPPRR